MRAPRRVPWATKSELNELYDWLFSPVSELSTRKRGLARVSASKSAE
jgi:ribosomal biogenesis protein LAS1